MKILLVSKFLHHVGGVETYLRWQAGALAAAGHEIGLVGMQPPAGRPRMELPGRVWLTPPRSYAAGSSGRLGSAVTSVWSTAAGSVMQRALLDFRPDLVHFHGTCYQLTPAVVSAVAQAGLPCALTAHEYKLVCANQTLYDDTTGDICTACSGASAIGRVLNPVRRSCMKHSKAVSLLGGLESLVSLPTWRRADPMILAPSPFMRDKLLDEGWRQDQVRYLDLPWRTDRELPPTVEHVGDDNVVFLGRLAPIKGVEVVLRAWERVAPRFPQARLRLLGDGEQESELRHLAGLLDLPRVDFLGRRGHADIQQELARAAVTVHPSQCHENSPYSVRESLMAGVPAICSRVGGMPAMISPETGWILPRDDVDAGAAGSGAALGSPRSCSPELLRTVTQRATTDEAHLAALEQAYAARLDRGGAMGRQFFSAGANG